jgi:hypothetical protein
MASSPKLAVPFEPIPVRRRRRRRLALRTLGTFAQSLSGGQSNTDVAEPDLAFLFPGAGLGPGARERFNSRDEGAAPQPWAPAFAGERFQSYQQKLATPLLAPSITASISVAEMAQLGRALTEAKACLLYKSG